MRSLEIQARHGIAMLSHILLHITTYCVMLINPHLSCHVLHLHLISPTTLYLMQIKTFLTTRKMPLRLVKTCSGSINSKIDGIIWRFSVLFIISAASDSGTGRW
ncbi:hypothetical protein BDW42DRAFT_172631 [Aspergillus taichungensis]|uniref:Uncharacterized protein n=1 Tax=Aspergillus taichungensis TaxID=482145 RepID=A0A2J5HQZ8_9EURO|nr:hypothetical protein BDW42DRAFT_172631 [Aspergillus taichungensis]